MTDRARQLLDLALQLSASERARMVDALLESLDAATSTDEVEASWLDECRGRLDRLDSDGETLSWREVGPRRVVT